MIKPTKKLDAIDLFCGAGGMSHGAEMSGRVNVKLAVNHWRTAIFTHETNMPNTRHICARVQDMDLHTDESLPSKCDLLMAGIECVFHSVARGGKPIDDQRRATAWRVIDWIEHYRPKWCVFENVAEFQNWGPLSVKSKRPLKSQKGRIFNQWIEAIRAYGYHVEWRVLNAADFGEATKRKRLFIICRRGRSKRPINWPAPTHCAEGVDGRQRWRTAREIIDWSKPAPSIFARKKPLAEKTLRRIQIGLEKFVAPFIVNAAGPGYNDPNFAGVHSENEPMRTITGKPQHGLVCPSFLTHYHSGADESRATRNSSVDSPVGTLDTSNRYGVCIPQLVNLKGTSDAVSVDDPAPTQTAGGRHQYLSLPFMVPHFGEREGQTPRTHSVDDPHPAVTSRPSQVAMPFLYQCSGRGDGRSNSIDDPTPTQLACRNNQYVALPWMMEVNHGGEDGRTQPIDSPIGTITTSHGRALVYAFLTQFYGTGEASSIDTPISTLTTKHRHGLALIKTMENLGVVDIGFRMLEVDELKAAQGFPAEYELHGTKADQVRQIGNSVCPGVMRAICEAITG